jgi:hypothetical protein
MEVGLALKVAMTGIPAAVTVTVVEDVESPMLLVAVMIYVVVEEGDTALVPEEDTAPMPGLMETDVAPVTLHDNVDGLPEVTELGLALKLMIAGRPEGATVILAVVVDGPVALVAVIVYVVVSAGVMVFEPLDETVPMPGLMETEVAPVMFHDSVADCPAVMVPGLALKLVMDGLPAAATVTVAHARDDPDILEAVNVYSVVLAGFTVCEPLDDTVPMSGLMETDWAPVMAQFSVADPPGATDVGLAANDVTDGGVSHLKTAPLVA